jgi:hypothetical protein
MLTGVLADVSASMHQSLNGELNEELNGEPSENNLTRAKFIFKSLIQKVE